MKKILRSTAGSPGCLAPRRLVLKCRSANRCGSAHAFLARNVNINLPLGHLVQRKVPVSKTFSRQHTHRQTHRESRKKINGDDSFEHDAIDDSSENSAVPFLELFLVSRRLLAIDAQPQEEICNFQDERARNGSSGYQREVNYLETGGNCGSEEEFADAVEGSHFHDSKKDEGGELESDEPEQLGVEISGEYRG